MKNKKTTSKKNLHLRLVFARFYKLITALLVILIVVGAYFFILEPKYNKSGQENVINLDSAKDELLKRQQHFEQLQILVKNYNQISPDEIARIKMILPRNKDIPGLFVQFQELAAKNNILLTSIDFNDTPLIDNSDGVKEISINIELLSVGGNAYQEVKKFIASVETNLRLFDIESVFFTPDSKSYSLTIIAYYY